MKKLLTYACASLVGFLSAGLAGSANAQTVFSQQLQRGDSGADVSALQTFLATDSTVYPEGLVTGYYGSLTEQAVARYQTKNGLPSVGRVGPLTLAKLNGASGTGGSTDVSAPLILNPSITTASSSASIRWMTSELANGRVYYGTSPLVMMEAASRGTMHLIQGSMIDEGVYRTDHLITLPSLATSTTYHYVIQSMDVAGNVALTWLTSFRTAP